MNKAFIKEVGFGRWTYRTAVRQFHKRVLKRDQSMRLPTGENMLLPISDHCATEVYITQANLDWGSEALFHSMLRKRGAFLDVGAHIGYYSLYMLPSVTAVYSFEPDPRVLTLLEKNLHNRPRTEIVPCAVGGQQGRASFTLEKDSEVSHLSQSDEKEGVRIEVDVITLDSFVSSRNLTVEAIKIDAEGHDIEVLLGANSLLSQQQPLILTEATPDTALFAITRPHGYRVFAYIRDPETRTKSFAEILLDAPPLGETKMLFLVPPSLVDALQKNAPAH